LNIYHVRRRKSVDHRRHGGAYGARGARGRAQDLPHLGHAQPEKRGVRMQELEEVCTTCLAYIINREKL
jgi:hypothetical protein